MIKGITLIGSLKIPKIDDMAPESSNCIGCFIFANILNHSWCAKNEAIDAKRLKDILVINIAFLLIVKKLKPMNDINATAKNIIVNINKFPPPKKLLKIIIVNEVSTSRSNDKI